MKCDERDRNRLLFLGSCLLGFSFLSKFNYVLDAVVVVIFCLFYFFYKKKLSIASLFSISVPVGVLGVVVFYYNYTRFGNGFESGMKYQTNALDFIHNALFAFNIDPAYNLALIMKRTYEIFFIPFHVTPFGKLALNWGPHLFSGDPRHLSIGLMGAFCVTPFLALFLFGLVKFRGNMPPNPSLAQQTDLRFFEFLILLLFFIHYLQSVYLLKWTYYYAVECLAYLSMFAILRFDIICLLYKKYPVVFTGTLLIGLLLQFSVS